MTQQLLELAAITNGEQVSNSKDNGKVQTESKQSSCLQSLESNLPETQSSSVPLEVKIDQLNLDPVKSESSLEKSSTNKRPKLSTVFNKDKTVEIRQGKLNFVESKINYQIHPTTIIELGQFHLAKYGSQNFNSLQLEEILRKFGPLIGKLIHESDLKLTELCLYVKEILCPAGFEAKDPWQDILLLSMVENIINEVAERMTYSVKLENSESNEAITSENLTVFRWEVRDLHNVFHSSMVPGIISRKNLRAQMINDAQILYNELPEDERGWITSTSSSKKRRKVELGAGLLNSKDLIVESKSTPKTGITKPILKALPKPVIEEKLNSKPTTSIKGFFSPVRKNQKNPVQVVSDYQKFFHPFRVKQNMTVAKIRNSGVTLLTNFDDVLYSNQKSQLHFDSNALLREFVINCQNQNQTLRELEDSKLTTINLDDSDDDETCSNFDSRNCGLKPKLLHFHENYRPAYFGAWLKESQIINGRRFLFKDTDNLDYDFDSEEEWQEEEEGELLADSEEDSEDDDDLIDKDDSDSENDDWIITEDEEAPLVGSENEIGNSVKAKNKNKKLTHLKPIIFGVCFDSQSISTIKIAKNIPLSVLSYCSFQDYTSPFPIDPFSSIPIESSKSTGPPVSDNKQSIVETNHLKAV